LALIGEIRHLIDEISDSNVNVHDSRKSEFRRADRLGVAAPDVSRRTVLLQVNGWEGLEHRAFDQRWEDI
jgi:hypothetical protein